MHKNLAIDTRTRKTVALAIALFNHSIFAEGPMTRLTGGKPEIPMPIEPTFQTANPAYTILDLAWKPRKWF